MDRTTTVVGSPKLAAAPHASTADLVVILQNDGPTARVDAAQVVFAGDATTVAATIARPELAAGRVTPLRVTVPVGHQASGDLQLALYLKAPADSVVSTSVPFKRDPSQIDVVPPLVGGLILAVVVLGAALVTAATPRRGPREPIEAASTFSFSSSWATNVVGLGALLSTVLASTDVLSVVVAGVSVTRLLAINVVFGGLVALAPLAVLAFGTRTQDGAKPTLFSFVLGCFLTTWAALGQLFGLVWSRCSARPDPVLAPRLCSVRYSARQPWSSWSTSSGRCTSKRPTRRRPTSPSPAGWVQGRRRLPRSACSPRSSDRPEGAPCRHNPNWPFVV